MGVGTQDMRLQEWQGLQGHLGRECCGAPGTVKERLWQDVTSPSSQFITNGTETNSKYIVISTPEKTELTISDLDMTVDPGTYVCNATNSQGSARETISLRVRSRLAALWPFLGIVAEVLVLVTIIFIYEKRRKPDQTLDGEQPWVWVSGWSPSVSGLEESGVCSQLREPL